jgi:hypothetical protein
MNFTESDRDTRTAPYRTAADAPSTPTTGTATDPRLIRARSADVSYPAAAERDVALVPGGPTAPAPRRAQIGDRDSNDGSPAS